MKQPNGHNSMTLCTILALEAIRLCLVLPQYLRGSASNRSGVVSRYQVPDPSKTYHVSLHPSGRASRPTTNVALSREPCTILLRLVTLLPFLVALEARPLGCGLMWWMLLGSGTWYLLTTPLWLLALPLKFQSSTRQSLVGSRA